MNIIEIEQWDNKLIDLKVAELEGWTFNNQQLYQKEFVDKIIILKAKYSPTTIVSQGKEIIEREKINIIFTNNLWGIPVFSYKDNVHTILNTNSYLRTGMLYFIAKKLGIIS